MPLSDSEINLLDSVYDSLTVFFITDLTDKNSRHWLSAKKSIIELCIEYEIRLFDIRSMKFSKSTELLTQLLQHITQLKEISAGNLEWQRGVLKWKKEFEENLGQANLEFVRLHHEAYISVGDQYIKTQKVSPTTLLTIKDMVTLFANPDFRSDDVLSSEPFSLEDQSPFLKARLEKLIHENDQNKTIFMPITHQGHWFYLLKQKDVWVIKDSQPFLEGDEFSARQTSILKHSIEFIERLTGLADPVVTFETTGEQNNDYDCGTQVTNAYRALTDKDHVRQPHKNILIELAQNQVLPKEKLPENIEEIFGPKLVAQPKLSGSPKSSTVIQKEQSSPIISETPMVLDLSISSGLPASSAPLFFLTKLQ